MLSLNLSSFPLKILHWFYSVLSSHTCRYVLVIALVSLYSCTYVHIGITNTIFFLAYFVQVETEHVTKLHLIFTVKNFKPSQYFAIYSVPDLFAPTELFNFSGNILNV